MALFDYNIEPTLEAGLVTLLQAQDLPAIPAQSADDPSTPRVSVRFELGEERDALHIDGGHLLANTWDGQFILNVSTDRDRNASSHSLFRAAVRRIMNETTQAQWETALGTRYRLLSIRHVGTVYDVLETEGIDTSQLTYGATIRFL